MAVRGVSIFVTDAGSVVVVIRHIGDVVQRHVAIVIVVIQQIVVQIAAVGIIVQIFVVDQFGIGDTPSTRQAAIRLAAVGDFTRYLVVLDRKDETSWLSLRNLPGVHVLAVDQLNAYDVVVSDAVVFTTAALEAFVAGPAKGKSVKAVATESEAAAQEDEK